MSLVLTGHVDLPPHRGPGGFDHAAIHRSSGRVFVAHTANDALDVIDDRSGRFLDSIPGLAGVAGALVSDDDDLVFTSNRGEDTVGIFPPDRPGEIVKIPVGVRPNGLAYDSAHRLLLAANVGDPSTPGSCTLSMVDVTGRKRIADVPVPGRTRWAVFDPATGRFYVNIGAPAAIVVIDPAVPSRVERTIDVPVAGPHGLDMDGPAGRLFCACDGAELVALDAPSGWVVGRLPISGAPDVIFHHTARRRLYVAVGDPGVIDVIDTDALARLESVPTERGAKTTALSVEQSRLYVFLPETHRAAVFVDS